MYVSAARGTEHRSQRLGSTLVPCSMLHVATHRLVPHCMGIHQGYSMIQDLVYPAETVYPFAVPSTRFSYAILSQFVHRQQSRTFS
jgi:hypothetical protein